MKHIDVIFTKYNKYVFNKFNKKGKGDYILNIDKIFKTKISDPVDVMNKYHVFILNYEMKKLLNKIINDTDKYTRIIYVNQNISTSSTLSMVKFLNNNYKNVDFGLSMYYSEDDMCAENISDFIPDIDKVDVKEKSEI